MSGSQSNSRRGIWLTHGATPEVFVKNASLSGASVLMLVEGGCFEKTERQTPSQGSNIDKLRLGLP